VRGLELLGVDVRERVLLQKPINAGLFTDGENRNLKPRKHKEMSTVSFVFT